MDSEQHWLVSGLSGQVGQGVVEATSSFKKNELSVSALVRRRKRTNIGEPNYLANQHIGDVRSAHWGLDVSAPGLNDVDVVVNLAGSVDWTASQAEMNRVNYLGAVNGLLLAEELGKRQGKKIPYVYASTTYVAGTSRGNIAESLHAENGDRTPYELSKWFAEHSLIEAAKDSGHPLLIVRIGGVIGSSVTSQTVRNSSLYQLVSPLRNREIRYLPVRTGGRIDILPRDVIGDGLRRLIIAGGSEDYEQWRGGRIVHLCAGDQAPTLEALFSALKSKDVDNKYETPNLIPVNDSIMRAAENVMLKYLRWDRERGNRLHGLRYVSIDRVFETSVLRQLADGWRPKIDIDSIVEICFGIRSYATESEPSQRDYPFGRIS